MDDEIERIKAEDATSDPAATVCVVAFAAGVHSSGYMQLEYDGTSRSRFSRGKT